MANGLFSMPTPAQVRRQAMQEIQQQGLGFGALPRGRASVAAAGMAGGLFGRALGEAMGGVDPAEQRAKEFQSIQQQVTKMAEEQKWDLTNPRDQIKMIGESIRRMGNFPEQQAMGLQMINQIRSTIPAEQEKYGDFEKISGTDSYGQRGDITGRYINIISSAEFNKRKLAGKGKGAGKGERPATPKAEDLTATEEALSNVPLLKVDDEIFTIDDFDSKANMAQYRLFVTERTKAYIADAENRGETMSEDVARNKAVQDASAGLQKLGGFGDDLAWDSRQASAPSFGQQTTETFNFEAL